jgi:hypothetical protein
MQSFASQWKNVKKLVLRIPRALIHLRKKMVARPNNAISFMCGCLSVIYHPRAGFVYQIQAKCWWKPQNGYCFSGRLKMKQAEIWFHMKKVPIYEDIMYKASIFWPETTGNSNCELSNLAWFSGVGKGKRPSCPFCGTFGERTEADARGIRNDPPTLCRIIWQRLASDWY